MGINVNHGGGDFAAAAGVGTFDSARTTERKKDKRIEQERQRQDVLDQQREMHQQQQENLQQKQADLSQARFAHQQGQDEIRNQFAREKFDYQKEDAAAGKQQHQQALARQSELDILAGDPSAHKRIKGVYDSYQEMEERLNDLDFPYTKPVIDYISSTGNGMFKRGLETLGLLDAAGAPDYEKLNDMQAQWYRDEFWKRPKFSRLTREFPEIAASIKGGEPQWWLGGMGKMKAKENEMLAKQELRTQMTPEQQELHLARMESERLKQQLDHQRISDQQRKSFDTLVADYLPEGFDAKTASREDKDAAILSALRDNPDMPLPQGVNPQTIKLREIDKAIKAANNASGQLFTGHDNDQVEVANPMTGEALKGKRGEVIAALNKMRKQLSSGGQEAQQPTTQPTSYQPAQGPVDFAQFEKDGNVFPSETEIAAAINEKGGMKGMWQRGSVADLEAAYQVALEDGEEGMIRDIMTEAARRSESNGKDSNAALLLYNKILQNR